MKTTPRLVSRAGLAAALFILISGSVWAQTVFVSNSGSGAGTTISQVSGGSVSTFATGLGSPGGPEGLAFDSSGNLYVANNHDNSLAKVTPGGVVSTFGSYVYQPVGLAFDGAGNLYVTSDGPGNIYKVSPTGSSTELFTSGLDHPKAVAFFAGELYVANGGAVAGIGSISKVNSSGAATTWVNLSINPTSMTFRPDGTLFVSGSNGTIAQINTFASVSYAWASGLTTPMGMAFLPNGNLLVGNYGADNVVEVIPSGDWTVFATGFDRPAGVAFAIPEPSTYAALAGLGVLGFAAYRRRRRQAG